MTWGLVFWEGYKWGIIKIEKGVWCCLRFGRLVCLLGIYTCCCAGGGRREAGVWSLEIDHSMTIIVRPRASQPTGYSVWSFVVFQLDRYSVLDDLILIEIVFLLNAPRQMMC